MLLPFAKMPPALLTGQGAARKLESHPLLSCITTLQVVDIPPNVDSAARRRVAQLGPAGMLQHRRRIRRID